MHDSITRPTQSGNEGELIARRYLEKKGLVFLTANWLCKMGEIDLVMQDGTTRVLVEVRLRRQTSYGQGVDTVAWDKQKKLIRAAKLYQQKERWWGDIRFDVISIILNPSSKPEIDHIEHAFMA